ncbi:MAG: Rieske 2Fe-2S domain-containing protein [Gemmatimonadales bacterium]
MPKSPTTDRQLAHDRGCSGCSGALDRRSFLERAGAGVLAALFALGADASASVAETIRSTGGRPLGGARIAYPIPAVDGVEIDKGHQVILVRWRSSAFAFNLSCPHQNTALRWEADRARFQCPKHHSKYQPDGEFISGRATRSMDRLAIGRQGAELVVDLDTMYKQDEQPAEWKAAAVTL